MIRKILLALFLTGITAIVCASTWQKQNAALMTTWGESLESDNVWQEYPRPSMVRESWINLNGVWDYCKRTSINLDYEPQTSLFAKAILVPFPVESALSGIMDTNFDENKRSTHMYRRTFSLTDAFAGKNVLLHFGAVDWRCRVYVNGQLAGSHDGGSDPFTFDITSLITSAGEQELQVAVWDPTSDGGQPNGKQSNNPGGIWYTPSSGIWQTVWLEPVAKAHVTSYEPIPDIDNGNVRIKVNATDADAEATVIVRFKGEEVARGTGKTGEFVTIAIPSAKLWSPDDPNLYDLDMTLTSGGKVSDNVKGYFGMRKFSRAIADGKPCLLLNNKPLFLYGPLDQGWWPDGLLTPPSYEAMVYDLQTMKDFGMNMVRKHIKVENDLWFDWCDRNGLVVWQDMPSGGTGGTIGNKEVCLQQFYDECEAIINATRHHPSIGAWVVFNESWGQDTGSGMEHTHKGVNRVMEANHDSGRFVHAVTGWVDEEMGDFIDVHSYPAPNAAVNPVNERVASCGEFGGINLFVKDHMWAGSDVNYTTVEDAETYTCLYDFYTDRLQDLQGDKGLWMSVYTQITDVEQECNGILTYDRKVKKVSDAQQAGMRNNILRTISGRYVNSTTLVPAGDEAADIMWKYTASQPEGEWYLSEYDDAHWTSGLSPFGGSARTVWNSSDIWIRRTFVLSDVSEDRKRDLRLWLRHDEDAEVYINGVLAAKVSGYNNNYEEQSLLPEALDILKIDGSENVIAIHCRQTIGGQMIDCGMRMRNYKSNVELLTTEVPSRTQKPFFAGMDGKAYIMAYTSSTNEQLHYAYSYDGATWTDINAKRPVFRYGDRLVNPFIRRISANGVDKFHLVAERTDGEAGLLHWTSDDMITWTPNADGSPEVKLVNAAQSYAQAPEIIYEPNAGQYYIYYNALVNGRNNIYMSLTRDFNTFSTPRQYFDPGFSARDVHIENMGGGYVAFFYNDNNNLSLASSSDLRTSRDRFSDFRRMFGEGITKADGAQTFPSLDDKGWFVYYRRTNGTGTGMSGSGDATEAKWYPYSEETFSMPEGMVKSSVVVVSEKQLQNILNTFDITLLSILPTAEEEPQTWRYSNSNFSTTLWTGVSYSDRNWLEGKSGFGGGTPPNTIIKTSWTTGVINLRYRLDLTGCTREQIDALEGRIYYDEDVTVYFNGIEAFSAQGYLVDYRNIALSKQALDALTPDADNIVAIRCINKGGGQYIDFGLNTFKPISTDINSLTKLNVVSKEGIFNLNGIKISEPQKGINIINGSKVYLK